MTNNDVLRRLRYALHLKNSEIISVFKLSGIDVTMAELDSFLKREEEEGYIECSNIALNSFLDGLIIKNRGLQKDSPQKADKNHLTNNIILKKIRVALQLKDIDILEILVIGDMRLTKTELSALFRNEDHRNYKSCGDQVFRKFLSGLSNKAEISNLLKR